MGDKTYTTADKDSKGRFKVGNVGGPGRGKGVKLEQNIIRWEKLCKGKHLDRVYWALLNECLKGNVAAIKIYLERAMGKIPDDLQITTKTQEIKSNPDQIRKEFDDLFRNKN